MKRVVEYQDYMTNEQVSMLLERSPGKASIKHGDKPEDQKKVNKLFTQLGYEYSFVLIFAPAVKGMYPIIEKLITTMEFPPEVTKESIVYLTICVMGILLNEPKAKYKALLDKVKEDGLFQFIKPLVTSFEGIKKIFTFISNRIGKVVKSFAEMFAYTALFVPFAMTFKDIIDSESSNVIMSTLSSFAHNGVGKVLSTGVGIGIFAGQHFMEEIIGKLKSFKDMGISSVKRIIDKIKSINLKGLFDNEEDPVVEPINVYNESILRFSEFTVQ
jgi:hypothetical protein